MGLTELQLEYAKLYVEDELTDEQIATKLGVERKTLWNWRQTPEMQEEIERLRELCAKEARGYLKQKSLKLTKKVVELALEGKTIQETQRKACERLLDHILGDPSKPETNFNFDDFVKQHNGT